MDSFCQVEPLRLSLSDDTVGVYERQAEPEHEDLDWDSFTTSLPLHQVEFIWTYLFQIYVLVCCSMDLFPWEHE